MIKSKKRKEYNMRTEKRAVRKHFRHKWRLNNKNGLLSDHSRGHKVRSPVHY